MEHRFKSIYFTTKTVSLCFQKGKFPYESRLKAISRQSPPLITNRRPTFSQKKHPHNTTTKSPNKSPWQSFCLPGLDSNDSSSRLGGWANQIFLDPPLEPDYWFPDRALLFLLCLLSSDKCWLELINALLSSCEFLVRPFVLKFHG